MSLSITDSPSGAATRSCPEGAALLRTAVLRAAVLRERTVAAHLDVLRQGETPRVAHVLLKGHTCRYGMLADGRRQITAVLVPGDICDLEAVLAGEASYSVGAMTECRLGEIALGSLEEIDEIDPEMRQILWRQTLRDEAISREWILGLGRRAAIERMAHLFCELWTRLRAVGLADANGCELRLTQGELGDVLGLSSVHVNRTLQELRATGLIRFQSGVLRILDHSGLVKLADFDPSYLRMRDARHDLD